MNTEHETRRVELPLVLQRIERLAEWARHANAYVDENNALPPDGIDDVTRERLVAGMEELGGLMHRYADSLRGFADRGSFGERGTTPDDGIGTAGFGTLLQFPVRRHPALMPPCGGDRAFPLA